MSKDKDQSQNIDPRVHLYLDGELSSSDAAAFEEELRADAVLQNQVLVLRGMTNWSQAARLQAPSSFMAQVLDAIEVDDAEEHDAEDKAARVETPQVLPLHAHPKKSGKSWFPLWLGGGLAAAAVLALVLGPMLQDRGLLNRVETPQVAENSQSSGSVGSSDFARNTIRYEFEFHAPDAEEVCLAGDFNQWKVCDAKLERVGENLWSIALELPRGQHEYMFVVDGQWKTDPGASLHRDDGFGNKNAVLSL